MRKKILLVVTSLVAGSVLFLLGFAVGHRAAQPVSRQLSSNEAKYVGSWHMVPEDGEPWKIAFLPDRTAVRFNSEGDREIVGNWGVVRDELSIQNQHHPDDLDSFLPPVTFKLAGGDDGLTLRTLNGAAEWRLVRM